MLFSSLLLSSYSTFIPLFLLQNQRTALFDVFNFRRPVEDCWKCAIENLKNFQMCKNHVAYALARRSPVSNTRVIFLIVLISRGCFSMENERKTRNFFSLLCYQLVKSCELWISVRICFDWLFIFARIVITAGFCKIYNLGSSFFRS